MKNKDISTISDTEKNKLLSVQVLGLNSFLLIKQTVRFVLAVSLIFSSLNVWSDSADMTVDINLSPVAKKPLAFPKGFKLNLIKYNKEEYLLAYNIFVMNGSVDLAYELAFSAVKQRPKNILWRKKLVNAALWSGHGEVALEQWMYLINNNINPDYYIPDALKLAGQLNDYDAQADLTLRQLEKDPKNKQLILLYSTALQNQGFPNESLKFLQKIPNVENDTDYLLQLVAISKGLDDPTMQLHYLQRLQIVDKNNTKHSLMLAELLYSKGDLSGAYNIYKSVAKYPDNKIAFWRGYATMSLLLGETNSAIYSYKQLVAKDAIDNPSLLQMISLEEAAGQREAAYRDAMLAYQNSKNPILIPVILSLGEQLNKWREMASLLASIPPEELAKLESKPESALSIINVKVHLGLILEAEKAWIWAFQRWPNVTIVQRAYLWFLNDRNDYIQLEYTLNRWKNIFRRKSDLWNVYSSSLTNVGDYPRALNVMLRHRNEVDVSYEYLANIANLFAQTNYPFSAYYAGQKAFYLIRKQINKQAGRLPLPQHLILAELMQAFAPDVMTYNVIVKFNTMLFKDPLVDIQVMSWALNKESYALASYIANVHKLHKVKTPPWMTLTLALVYNNRDDMADVLFKYPKILPHRDRVTAAVRTGNLKLAEEYAYRGLKEHPTDYLMYSLFEDTMLPRANKFSVDFGEYTNAGVGGPFGRARLRMFVTPSVSVTTFGGLWFPRVNNFQNLAYSPDLNQTTGIAVRKYIEKGWIQGSVAERSSLEEFLVARLKWNRQISSTTVMRLTLNYHELADETGELMIAGMKDEATMSLDTIVDKYNILQTELKIQRFLGQDNSFLGTGQELQFHWQTKFYLEYPDWNINFYLRRGNYQNSNKPLSLKLQRFLPVDDDSGSNFFMPPSNTEGGVTLGFGQQYKKEYNHSWKLFGEAGLLYNYPFGFGQLVEAGVAGSVIGRDHLALYVDYSYNQQQAAQKLYTIGIRYDNYF